MEISELIKRAKELNEDAYDKNEYVILTELISLAEKFEAVKGFPQEIDYYHSKKAYPDNCVEAYNKAIDDCKLAVAKNLPTVEEIARSLLMTKHRWESLQDYEKVSLPTAGVKLFAEDVYILILNKLTKGAE